MLAALTEIGGCASITFEIHFATPHFTTDEPLEGLHRNRNMGGERANGCPHNGTESGQRLKRHPLAQLKLPKHDSDFARVETRVHA
jgi:hypothetical protein